MLPLTEAPRPLTLWRMRESLEDLWLIVDALLEPGGVKMAPLPRRETGGAGDGREQEERLLWEVRQSLTILLQAIDEELLRSEGDPGLKPRSGLRWPERERRQDARDILIGLRGRLITDFTKSLTELNRS